MFGLVQMELDEECCLLDPSITHAFLPKMARHCRIYGPLFITEVLTFMCGTFYILFMVEDQRCGVEKSKFTLPRSNPFISRKQRQTNAARERNAHRNIFNHFFCRLILWLFGSTA